MDETLREDSSTKESATSEGTRAGADAQADETVPMSRAHEGETEQQAGEDKPQGAGKTTPAPASDPKDSPFISLGSDGSGQQDAGQRRRRPIIAAVLAACCVALIVVSLGFVHPGSDGGWSLAWLAQTTEESTDAAGSGSAASTAAGSAAVDAQTDEAGASEGSADADAASDGSTSDDQASGASSGADEGDSASSTGAGVTQDAAGGQSSSSGAAASGGQATSGSGDSSANGAASGSQTTPAPSAPAEQNTITVSVSVSSSAVGGPVSASGTYTFAKGATAYDALCALGLSVNATNSAFGVYVAAIGGLAEKEHGDGSGWNYAVNGSTPGMSAGNYVLSDGDSVSWFYITG